VRKKRDLELEVKRAGFVREKNLKGKNKYNDHQLTLYKTEIEQLNSKIKEYEELIRLKENNYEKQLDVAML
jgi:peptidoglycan hydrolase CwlO-like protein